MMKIRELTMLAIILRILFAIVLGGIIGMERGLKNRPAGLRTYMLVCIGSCIVMITNQYVYQVYGYGDPVRMGAQVISGIGFLGAGTIVVTSHNQIKGLTTAAGLWATACIGLALGIGLYEIAIVGGISIFVVFTLLHHWDSQIRRYTRVVDVYVELDKNIPLGMFLRNVRERDIELSNIQMEREDLLNDEFLTFVVTLHGKKMCERDLVVRTVRKIEGVRYLEEL